MRPQSLLLLPLPLLLLPSCERHHAADAPATAIPIEEKAAARVDAGPLPAADPAALLASVVRVNATQQAWDQGQPWQKRSSRSRRSLAAVVGDRLVLTTAEMVADATYIEMESPDGRHLAPARVVAVDYEANLALLGPATEAENAFFADTKPLPLASPARPGDTLEIVQVEENGTPLVTTGVMQSVDVISNFLPGQFFLAYEVKASMQSAASSFSLPVLHEGKLAGVLTSYDSKDQISDVTSTEIVARFIESAADGEYSGFPSLGISIQRTEDPNFRLWLKLPEDGGGLYIASVRPGSAAEKAGLKKGDVLTAIDGREIDRLGYFQDDRYGRLYWSHLVRGMKANGDTAALTILRDGQPQDLTATLDRREETGQLVPSYTFGSAPAYLVKGGMIFQELTRPLMEAFGNEWESRAPLNLLDVLKNPEKYESRARRIVFLSNVIPTPATVGYEPLQNLIVTKVNGVDIKDMKSLVEAFDKVPADGLHAIEFADEEFKVYLDETATTAVDEQLLQRGLPRLSRTGD